MIKTKKQMFIVIGAFLLTIILGTTTYARIDGGPSSQTPGYLTLKNN